MKLMYGGYLSTIPLLGLAIAGILVMKFEKIQDLYMWFFMAATSAIFLIGGETVKSRLFYNIPIGPISALGLVTILKNAGSYELRKSIVLFITIRA